jgi:hypothetical protein
LSLLFSSLVRWSGVLALPVQARVASNYLLSVPINDRTPNTLFAQWRSSTSSVGKVPHLTCGSETENPERLRAVPTKANQWSYSRRFPLSGPRYRSRSGVKARSATPQGLGLDTASSRDTLAAGGKRRTQLVCCFISSLTKSKPVSSVLHPPVGPHIPGISTDLPVSAVPGRRSQLCAPGSLHRRIAP